MAEMADEGCKRWVKMAGNKGKMAGNDGRVGVASCCLVTVRSVLITPLLVCW